MTTCTRCGLAYPDHLVNTMVSLKQGQTRRQQVCGICALEDKNATLGTQSKRFAGEVAESARLGAIAYRKQIGWTP